LVFCLPFAVVSGLSLTGASAGSFRKPDPKLVGKTLAERTKTSGCTVGPNPDRRCSPGAYYSKLTKAVLCSADFTTTKVRYVPQSVKYTVEGEYGMEQKKWGGALEIDHIVSLELGGSNEIANLFPEGLYGTRATRSRTSSRTNSTILSARGRSACGQCSGRLRLTGRRCTRRCMERRPASPEQVRGRDLHSSL
jgi:hypothetical protein